MNQPEYHQEVAASHRKGTQHTPDNVLTVQIHDRTLHRGCRRERRERRYKGIKVERRGEEGERESG